MKNRGRAHRYGIAAAIVSEDTDRLRTEVLAALRTTGMPTDDAEVQVLADVVVERLLGVGL